MAPNKRGAKQQNGDGERHVRLEGLQGQPTTGMQSCNREIQVQLSSPRAASARAKNITFWLPPATPLPPTFRPPPLGPPPQMPRGTMPVGR